LKQITDAYMQRISNLSERRGTAFRVFMIVIVAGIALYKRIHKERRFYCSIPVFRIGDTSILQ